MVSTATSGRGKIQSENPFISRALETTASYGPWGHESWLWARQLRFARFFVPEAGHRVLISEGHDAPVVDVGGDGLVGDNPSMTWREKIKDEWQHDERDGKITANS